VRLLGLRFVGPPPLGELALRFADDEGTPRPVTVLVGAGGTGKTTLLAALAATRPGNATVLPRRGRDGEAGYAVADFSLGDDLPERETPFRVASPLALLPEETDAESLARRRDQAAVDKIAQASGFAFLAVPGVRWFSRGALVLSSPERSILRHDARAVPSFDDATRADLCRETKQVLVYAAISAALVRDGDGSDRRGVLGFERGLVSALDALNGHGVLGFRFVGACPTTFEPLFASNDEGRLLPFDDLPTAARHAIAFVALPLRALAAAYPDRSPGTTEGVVLIDDAELHQSPDVLAALPRALTAALPRVQWILATSARGLAEAVPEDAVIVLRRVSSNEVGVFAGHEARTH
jgi:hypothetical protein